MARANSGARAHRRDRTRLVVAMPAATVLAAAMLAAAALAACHGAPLNPWVSIPNPRFAGRAFGDTASLRTSIVAIDTLRDVVVFTLAAPAHVVVLDVSPGKSISPLYPQPGSRTLLQATGEHMMEVRDPGVVEDQAFLAQAEYNRCVDKAEDDARRRRAAARPRVRRDSAGRVIQSSVDEQSEYDRASDRPDPAVMRACQSRANMVRGAGKAARKGEHYLVVLASPNAVSGTELAERIATLSVTGSDVATTIEAIGAGLFVGRTERWAGYYVSR